MSAAEPYDRHYYQTGCGPIPYDRSHPHWLAFFGAIADRIVADIGPRTVLDVGCAKGFLVEALRDRGVEAFGIDVSQYAIGEVRPDIRPFCWIASAVNPFPRRYDLVVCIEVLEHLPAHEGQLAIQNICRSTEDVLFSSTSSDVDEPTHVNVRPRSYWIEGFGEQGFHMDVEFDAGFVAPHAMRFRAGQTGVSVVDEVLAQRDQRLAELARLRHNLVSREASVVALESELADLRDELARNESARAAADAELRSLGEAHAEKDRIIAALRGEHERLLADATALREREAQNQRSIRDARSELDALRASAREADRQIYHLAAYVRLVHGTIGWKILERIRRYRDRLAPRRTRRGRAYTSIRDRAAALLGQGVEAKSPVHDLPPEVAAQPAAEAVTAEPGPAESAAGYQAWLRRHGMTAGDIAAMRRRLNGFAYRPCVSVITPVYNTPEVWLRSMVGSIQGQIYPDWELCLVNDGSTDPLVGRVLEDLAAADPRIRVQQLPRNEGIAGASAHALRMATGEFVALVDHDDELSRDALFEVVARLAEEPDLDLLYSDEDKLDLDGRRVEPFFKPDWSPDLLLSMNYIAHLTVFRRRLVEAAGGFRPGFEGSQDYDLLLRVAERTSRIAHIPKVLYHWRKTPESVSMGHAAKPFAQAAAERALSDALDRRGREGRVESVSPGRYTVRYALLDRPLVSIIIPTRDRAELLRQCIDSIEKTTDYAPYEILVLDNDSIEPATHDYLEKLGRRWRVIRCSGLFNFARINNLGVAEARGKHYVFLNNDTRVLRGEWLRAMLEQAQRPEVGAVGARLLYPDASIQHAGVVLGIGGVAGHAFKHCAGHGAMYFDLPNVVRNCSAVTAACMMVPKHVFEEVGGFDERFAVAFNDVDLCCRIRARGYLIVYTPLAELCHLESASRKLLHPPADEALMWERWGDTIRAGDPYYNPNLTLTREDWRVGP